MREITDDQPTQEKRVAEILSKIATERRCKILRVLIDAEEPISSSMLATVTGMTEAAASFNLTAMLASGILIKIPSGRWAFYMVNSIVLSIVTDFFKPQETTDECSGTT